MHDPSSTGTTHGGPPTATPFCSSTAQGMPSASSTPIEAASLPRASSWPLAASGPARQSSRDTASAPQSVSSDLNLALCKGAASARRNRLWGGTDGAGNGTHGMHLTGDGFVRTMTGERTAHRAARSSGSARREGGGSGVGCSGPGRVWRVGDRNGGSGVAGKWRSGGGRGPGPPMRFWVMRKTEPYF